MAEDIGETNDLAACAGSELSDPESPLEFAVPTPEHDNDDLQGAIREEIERLETQLSPEARRQQLDLLDDD